MSRAAASPKWAWAFVMQSRPVLRTVSRASGGQADLDDLIVLRDPEGFGIHRLIEVEPSIIMLHDGAEDLPSHLLAQIMGYRVGDTLG